MNRKIMVEVSEEELKSLDKVKTLDDIVEELINYFDTHKCDKSYSDYDKISGDGVINKKYITPNGEIQFSINSYGVIYVGITRKPNNREELYSEQDN